MLTRFAHVEIRFGQMVGEGHHDIVGKPEYRVLAQPFQYPHLVLGRTPPLPSRGFRDFAPLP